jgi:hypothetical protein
MAAQMLYLDMMPAEVEYWRKHIEPMLNMDKDFPALIVIDPEDTLADGVVQVIRVKPGLMRVYELISAKTLKDTYNEEVAREWHEVGITEPVLIKRYLKHMYDRGR